LGIEVIAHDRSNTEHQSKQDDKHPTPHDDQKIDRLTFLLRCPSTSDRFLFHTVSV
jgi:hypothetical protein